MDTFRGLICPETSDSIRSGRGDPPASSPELDLASLIQLPEYQSLRKEVIAISNSGLSSTITHDRLDTLFTHDRSKELGGHDPAAVLEDLRITGTRQMCQYQFRKNDIVWICKTCQRDETCVLCNACFPFSSHDGHEVYFYHSQAGGCCDCGDPEAWSPEGFCKRHGNKSDDPLVTLPEAIKRGGGVVLEAVAQYIEFFATQHAKTFEIYPKLADIGSSDERIHTLILYSDDIHSEEGFRVLLRRLRYVTPDQIKAIMSSLATNSFVEAADPCPLSKLIDTLNINECPGCDPRSFAWSIAPSPIQISNSDADRFIYQHDKGSEAFLAFLEWLTRLTAISDGICRLISACFPVDRLCQIIKSDARLNPKCIRALHSFFLSLMADISFKRSVAIAYATCLPQIVSDFASGIGTADLSIFRISVQFLNKPLIVDEIIKSNNLLESYAGAFYEIFKRPMEGARALSEDRYEQDDKALKHFVIRCKKYECIIGDLKVIFILPGVPRLYCMQSLDRTLDGIAMCQYANAQVRCVNDHHIDENENWIKSFNLELTLATFSDYLLSWIGEESPVPVSELLRLKTEDSYPGLEQFSEAISDPDKYSVLSPLVLITKKIYEWHKSFPRSDLTMSPSFSTNFGFSFIEPLPDVSYHIVLHRLLAHCIQECCRSPEATNALTAFHRVLAPNSTVLHESRVFHVDQNAEQLSEYYSKLWWFYCLLDFPLNCLMASAQIRAKLWVRNGTAMLDQNLNYSEYPFCNFFRDMDILLVQYLGVVCGSRLLLNFILSRFDVYLLLSTKRFGASHSDPAKNRLMIDEALNLIITLVTELPLPPVVPLPADSRLEQAEDGCNTDSPGRIRMQLRREVIHRLMVGASTYSQLHELRSLFRGEDKICEDVIDDVVDEVGIVQKGDRIEDAVKIFLKPQFWSEYDPGFYHFGVQHHQHVLGNRPKIKITAPACPAPPIAHPTFLPLRHGLLVEPALLSYVRDFLYSFVAQRFEKYLDRRQLEGNMFPVRAPEAPVWATSAASGGALHAVGGETIGGANDSGVADRPRSITRPNFLGDADSMARIPYFVSASIASKSWAIQCTDATFFKSIHILTLLMHHVEKFQTDASSDIPEYMKRNFEIVAEYMGFCPHIMVSPPLAAFVDHLVQYPDNNSSPDVASMLQQHITAASSGMTTPYFTSGLGSMITSTVNSSRNSRAQSFDDGMSITDYSIPSHESGINTHFTPLYSSMGTTGILSDRFVSVNTSELPMPLPEANNAGVALSMPSLVHVMLMAYNMLHGEEDIEHRCHIRWLLDRVRCLFPTSGKLISEWMKEELDNERAEKLKQLQASAKERATAQIQALAQSFVKSEEYIRLTAGRVSAEVGGDKSTNEGLIGEKRGAADEDYETKMSGDACIICGYEGVRGDANATDGALGYLVLCQEVRQRAVWDSEPEMHLSREAKADGSGAGEYPGRADRIKAVSSAADVGIIDASVGNVCDLEKNSASNLRMHFRFCGHAMHFSCYDSFIPQVIAQSQAQQNLILDINKDEFQCPLCKNVSNALVPAVCLDTVLAEQHLNLDKISLVEASADRRSKVPKLEADMRSDDRVATASSNLASMSSGGLVDWILRQKRRSQSSFSNSDLEEESAVDVTNPTHSDTESRAKTRPIFGSTGWFNRAITALDAINSIIQGSAVQSAENHSDTGDISEWAIESESSHELSEEAVRIRNYWMRYLSGIVVPFSNHSASSLHGSAFLDAFARVLNSISFTLSVECSENSPGLHLLSKNRGMDNVKEIAHVLDSLCLTAGAFGASHLLNSSSLILGAPIDALTMTNPITVPLHGEYAALTNKCIANVRDLPGASMAKQKIRSIVQALASYEKLARPGGSIGENLLLPLLARPIADVLIQSIGSRRLQESIIAANDTSKVDGAFSFVEDSLRESEADFVGGFKWLIIARLVQLVLLYRIESIVRTPKKHQKISFSDQKPKSEGLSPILVSMIGAIDGVVSSFLAGEWEGCGSAEQNAADAIDGEGIQRLLFEWIAFIRDAIHAMTRCGMCTRSSSSNNYADSSGGIFNSDRLQGIIRGLSECRMESPNDITNQIVEAHLAATDLDCLLTAGPSFSPDKAEAVFDELDRINTEPNARLSELSPTVLIRYKAAKWLRALYPEEVVYGTRALATPVNWSDVQQPLRRALERGDLYKYICRADGSGFGFSCDQVAAVFQDPSDVMLANVLNGHAFVYYSDRKDVINYRPYMRTASKGPSIANGFAAALQSHEGTPRDESRFHHNASTLGLFLGMLRNFDSCPGKKTVNAASARANQLVPFIRHRIMPFPDSYTKFHHFVRAICDFEYPAVCVSCGLVIDAGGKGLCTAHVGDCSGASGAFFLLQDCQMLFLYHRRASYMPAPFVDDHGEKHKHFRGKPLHLDPQKYELLRSLIAACGIPSAVVHKRSTAQRVIIENHY